MQVKTKFLLGCFLNVFFVKIQAWCNCQNNYPAPEESQKRQDLNRHYVNSDEFRNNNNVNNELNYDRRLPQLPQRTEIERLPDEYAGHNPLQFHVEANYEEPNPITNNFRHGERHHEFPLKFVKMRFHPPFPVNPNWKPRIPGKHTSENKGTKWLPIKLPSFITEGFKHLPKLWTPPWMPKKHFPYHAVHRRPNKIVDHDDDDEEGNDIPMPDFIKFLEKYGITQVTRWSENSDPEEGFKSVKVVLPKQIWIK